MPVHGQLQLHIRAHRCHRCSQDALRAQDEGLSNLVFTIASPTIDLRVVDTMRAVKAKPVLEPTPEPDNRAWVAAASVRGKKEILALQGPPMPILAGIDMKGGEFAKFVEGDVKQGHGIGV